MVRAVNVFRREAVTGTLPVTVSLFGGQQDALVDGLTDGRIDILLLDRSNKGSCRHTGKWSPLLGPTTDHGQFSYS